TTALAMPAAHRPRPPSRARTLGCQLPGWPWPVTAAGGRGPGSPGVNRPVTAGSTVVTRTEPSSRLYVTPLSLPATAVFAGLLMPQYACPVTVAVSHG